MVGDRDLYTFGWGEHGNLGILNPLFCTSINKMKSNKKGLLLLVIMLWLGTGTHTNCHTPTLLPPFLSQSEHIIELVAGGAVSMVHVQNN